MFISPCQRQPGLPRPWFQLKIMKKSILQMPALKEEHILRSGKAKLQLLASFTLPLGSAWHERGEGKSGESREVTNRLLGRFKFGERSDLSKLEQWYITSHNLTDIGQPSKPSNTMVGGPKNHRKTSNTMVAPTIPLNGDNCFENHRKIAMVRCRAEQRTSNYPELKRRKQEQTVLERSARLNLDPGRGD